MKSLRFVTQKTPTAQPGAKRIEQVTSEPITPRGADFALSLSDKDCKSFDKVTDEKGTVIDYRNVVLKGYLSTFGNMDRDGEYVVPGAFKSSIEQFMQNPVLLVDHENSVDSIAGKFTVVKEDAKGLYVEARLTDSPAEWARDIRHKVANDELRTLSMGGFFTYDSDGRGIKQVALYEGSLTPIPANPACRFSTRALDPDKEGELITKAVSELKRLARAPHVKLMDKPRQPAIPEPKEGQDAWDQQYYASRASDYADNLGEWAADQGTKEAHAEACAAHKAAADHCQTLATMMKSAGNTLSAHRMARANRKHVVEANYHEKCAGPVEGSGAK